MLLSQIVSHLRRQMSIAKKNYQNDADFSNSRRQPSSTQLSELLLRRSSSASATPRPSHLRSTSLRSDGAGPSQSTPQPSTIDQITQQVRAELRDELREELRAEFSTHLQQMRAEMMALVSQGASVDPNRQVPAASSGHRAFRESAEDENPYTPPPEDQIFPE
ncbi:hypothetical protein ACSBR2_006551 [Camellia fascicularis]